MYKCAVIFLLVACCLLLGCPQPIDDANGNGTVAAGGTGRADGGLEVTMEHGDDPVAESGGGNDDALEPPEDQAGETVEDTAAGTPAGTPDEDVKSGGLLESLSGLISGGGKPEPVETPGIAGEPPSAEPVETPADAAEETTSDAPVDVDPEGMDDPQAALDAGRMLWVDEDEPADSAYEEPPARVGRDSVAFAGEWTAVVVNQEGRARLTGGDDEWLFNLDEDGRCRVIQRVNGEIWEQSGGWEYVNAELTLSLGPGGRRVYSVEQPGDDVSILTDGAAGAVLFCLRVDPQAGTVPLQKHYDSDFGAITFRRSGQSYWKGTYGEPEGSLLVHPMGSCLAGTWEQQPGKGFVLLTLTTGGFDGWWWYEASTQFDGEWRGNAAD